MIKFIVEANNIEINYNFMYNLPYIWTRLTMCDRLSSTDNRLPNAVLQQTVASSPRRQHMDSPGRWVVVIIYQSLIYNL